MILPHAVGGTPLADAVESIQTFSTSEEVIIPDYPPVPQDLQRVPAHITRFENDRDRCQAFSFVFSKQCLPPGFAWNVNGRQLWRTFRVLTCNL